MDKFILGLRGAIINGSKNFTNVLLSCFYSVLSLKPEYTGHSYGIALHMEL